MQNIETLFKSLVAWVDWLLLFARKYANYLALGLLAVMVSRMLKIKSNINVGGK